MRIENASSKYLSFVIIGTFFSISPWFNSIGIGYTFVLGIKSLLLISYSLIFPSKIKLSLNSILFIGILLMTSLFTALYYSNDYKIVFVSAFFIVSLLYVDILNIDTLKYLVGLFTISSLVFLGGAWVSLFYGFIGGQPIYEFSLPDGRPIYLFITSLTNTPDYIWKNTGIIRPSAIFDEPGAFSFFLCFTALIRSLFRQNAKITWAILFLGLVTFSLAHITYMIIHALSQKYVLKFKTLVFSVVVTLCMFVFVINSKFGEALDRLLINRFVIEENGTISGDNRSGQLIYNFQYINANNFFWGLSEECLINVGLCKNKFPGIGGENPLAPILLRGVFISWPYYFVIVFLFYLSLKRRKNIIFFALALLFFQRPYIMNLGYAYYALIPIYTYYLLKKNDKVIDFSDNIPK